ncbi:MAG: SDR family oxidoreductase [Deltaproteobacteria bacterium]|nr:SDR family oxidoreductase [Deltaproteobacteria bacterium]
MVKTLDAETKRIDILVNNAGISQVVPLALMEEEDWDKMMDTNVKGAFLSTQAVLRTMIREKYGRILNMSSLAGVKMLQAPVHYCAAKSALIGFTEGLAKEIGRYGVTVNAIAPGILDEGVALNVPDNKKAEYLGHCSLGRLGTVEEVAKTVAFLVSDRNSYMNGATVVVDGGV